MSNGLQESLSSFKLSRSETRLRRLAATSSGDSSHSPTSSLKTRDVTAVARPILGASTLSDPKIFKVTGLQELSGQNELRPPGREIELLPQTEEPRSIEVSKPGRSTIPAANITPTTPSPAPSPRTLPPARGQSSYFDSQHTANSAASTPRVRPVAPRTRSADI